MPINAEKSQEHCLLCNNYCSVVKTGANSLESCPIRLRSHARAAMYEASRKHESNAISQQEYTDLVNAAMNEISFANDSKQEIDLKVKKLFAPKINQIKLSRKIWNDIQLRREMRRYDNTFEVAI